MEEDPGLYHCDASAVSGGSYFPRLIGVGGKAYRVGLHVYDSEARQDFRDHVVQEAAALQHLHALREEIGDALLVHF